MRGNSSDGSNGKMTGWFWKRGVGCLRDLGLDGEFFCLVGFWTEWGRKIDRGLWGIEVFRNGYPEFLVA